ncbi:DUF1559 family PulG-like putative transporter [Alienimonas californiensis]|uniref:DUF1559 family PulG-like putative transporter n=1 Tax=Alienimonas californiensis TaxID=2527989 RepID=UPI0013FD0A5B|nr:DUF1559 domain-containing protein [Alienimonas californiensis]
MLALIAVLVSLLLPAVQQSRERARAMQCVNSLTNLGAAMHHYHAVHRGFPIAQGGTDGGGDPTVESNAGRLSTFVPLTPYLDAPPLWEAIRTSQARPKLNEGGWDDPGGDPYADELYEEVADDTEDDGRPQVAGPFPPFGPHPDEGSYEPWATQLPILLCPSDGAPGPAAGEVADTNYVLNWGDHGLYNGRSDNPRGVAKAGGVVTLDEITDGLGNTLLMSETRRGEGGWAFSANVAVGLPATIFDDPQTNCVAAVGDPVEPGFYGQTAAAVVTAPLRGDRWTDGAVAYTGFNTILPPGGPSCVVGGTRTDEAGGTVVNPAADFAGGGILSAGSHHLNGVNVLLADGSVRWIANEIDAGDPHAGQPTDPAALAAGDLGESPYGLWGALGTRAAGELTGGF